MYSYSRHVNDIRRVQILLMLASTALAPGVAWAQTPSTVEEVVVTAQRRTERLVDVPIAISVVGGQSAQSAGVVSTRDLPLVTPGLIAGQTGFAFLPSIRGISSTGTGAGDEANVAVYVDGVYVAQNKVTAFNLADIERIEVLKGPQGTLFGRNATGGAIRVVTSNPSFDPTFKAMASAGFSKPKSRELSLYGSAGLGETLAASLTGYIYDDSGYLTNSDPAFSGDRQGSLQSYIVRGKLLYAPTDALKVIGAIDYSQSISGVELTTTFVNNVSAFKNVVGVIPALGEREVGTNEQNYNKGLSWGASLHIEHKSDHYTVSSISALREGGVRISLDNDRTRLTTNRTQQKVESRAYSQELNLASTLPGPLNFIAGVYLFHQDAGDPYANVNAATIGPVVNGVRTVTGPLLLTSSITDTLKTTSYSAFGEATYAFSDRLSLVGGLRYSIDYKTARSSNLLNRASPEVTTKNHWDNVSYRLTAKYKPTPDSLLYASNSTGFKSGNINAPTYPFPNPHDQVLPETVTAYEVGYKTRLLDGLELSASAFHYDYKNIQLTTNNALSAAAGRVGINILQNAAKAKISGADAELIGQLDEHWGWRLGASWLPKAEYADFKTGLHFEPAAGGLGAVSVSSDLSGSRILRSPKMTVNAGVNYRTELAGGELSLSTNYYRTTRLFLAVGEAIEQPSYDIVGAEGGWTDPSGRYTFSVWGRNLTDAAYFLSGNVNTGGFAAVWAKPREIGVRLHAQY